MDISSRLIGTSLNDIESAFFFPELYAESREYPNKNRSREEKFFASIGKTLCTECPKWKIINSN
jgi:hypothetical protein